MTRSGDRGTLPPGFRLREFQVERVLGEGGFGVVYLAVDTRLERRVAIKEYMPSQLATRDADWSVHPRSSVNLQEAFEAGRRSFINEAKLLASFEHPSLVRVYQFWEEKGTAYMVMPYYASPTFKQWRKQHDRAPDEGWLVSFLDALIDAVDALHRQQCLHRDVAPDNVLVLDARAPLLLDFGAARRVIGDLTQTLTVMLKPGFAPIEQYAETTSLRQGPWTDVYALSAVGYFAITGRAPPQSVGRIVHDELQPLAQAAAGRYAPHVLAALDAGLAVRPESRPQSMGALRALLYGEAQVDDDRTVVSTRPGMPAAAPNRARTAFPPTVPMPASPAPATLHSTFRPTEKLDDERTRRLPAIDDDATITAGTAPTLARSTIPTFALTPTQRERVLHPADDETVVEPRTSNARIAGKRTPPRWWLAGAVSGLGVAIVVGAWWMNRPRDVPGQTVVTRAPLQEATSAVPGAPPGTSAASSTAAPAGAGATTAGALPLTSAAPTSPAVVGGPSRTASAPPASTPASPASARQTPIAAAPSTTPASTTASKAAAAAPASAASTPAKAAPTPATTAPASTTPTTPRTAAPQTAATAPATPPATASTAATQAAASPPVVAPPRVLRAPDGPPPLQIADTGITALQVAGTVKPDEKEPRFSGYTCCNLHFSGDWFSDLNYSSYDRIPPGTPIKVTGYGRWRVLVELDGKPMRLGLDYGRREESLAQFARKLTVDRDPKARIASFPPIVQDAIRAAKLMPGMTREQVVMAVGFPARNETASVNLDQWKMWHTSRGSYTVVFDDGGRVKDIVVDDWLRDNVVYSRK